MKSILLPLALCAGLSGCVAYGGDPYYGGGYGGSYGGSYYSGGAYAQPAYIYGAQPGYYYDGNTRRYRDRDRDGIPNRMDRDRDNDGVRNRLDRDRDGDGVRNRDDDRPNNPRRH